MHRTQITHYFKKSSRIIYVCLLIALSLPSYALADTGFQQWIDDFYTIAAKEGITRTTYDRTFKGVSTPDPAVLKKAAYQPEFTTQIWEYLDNRVTPHAVKIGQKMEVKYQDTLEIIERDLGVSRYVVLAIWSMESNYGAILKRTSRLHYVPRALATLGYKDKKRSRFAKNQLIAILSMVQEGVVQPEQLMGSWAGAMGHTQFIPTSYKAYSVSLDGIPGSDIWTSVPDALGTAASLLKNNGWQTGKTWGYEVYVPKDGDQYNGETKTLAEWQALGFKRPSKTSFPRLDEKAELKMLVGETGPGFLMVRNFFVIKKYNNSNFYALAVGLLSDQIAGVGEMQQKWPRPAGSLDVAEKYELQVLLKAQGYYDGEIDGSLGSGSRKAIKGFQKANNLKTSGLANQKLLKLLRTK